METVTGERAIAIEKLMDSIGNMTDFADILAAIAREKVDHIRTNWSDDEARAKCWERWADGFDKLSAKTADPYGN